MGVSRATREPVLLHLIRVQAHVHLLWLTHCPTKSSLSLLPVLAGPLYRVAEYQFSSPIGSLNVGVVSAAQKNGAL